MAQNNQPTNNPTNLTNAQGGTMTELDKQPAKLTNTQTGEVVYGTAGELGRRFYADGMSKDGWVYTVETNRPAAPEAAEATEPTPTPNGWEILPGASETPLTASESYVLTVGDRCPECPDGRIIRGRSGLGCSGYRNGCTVHERIREDGRYFPAVSGMPEPSSPSESMNAAEVIAAAGIAAGIRTPFNAKPTPAPAPAPQPIIEVSPRKYKAGEVDPEARERVEDQRRYLEGLGFATADTVYPPGTQVIGMGHENFKKHQRDLEIMPTIEEECARKGQIIANENRRGFTVAIKDMTFDGDVLRLPNGQPLKLEWNALKSWSGVRSGRRAHDGEKVSISPPLSYLRHSSADEVGQMFEARKRHAQFVEKKSGRPQRVQLLTREVDGQERSVYAVVSPTYQYYGGDRFLQNIAKAARQFGSDLKGEVTYNQATTRVTGEFWAMPPHIENLAAGDVFKVGARFRTGDNGATSHTIDAAYLRNLCLNLLILDRGALNLMKRRHSGRVHATSYKLNHEIITAMRKAFEFEQEFRTRYGWMKEQTVGELFGTDDMEEIVKDVLTAQRPKSAMKAYSLMDGLPKEIQRDALVEALLLGVTETAAETGQRTIIEPTMADIINVVTRAHDKVPVLAYSGDSVADHIARRAGEMVTEFGKVAA